MRFFVGFDAIFLGKKRCDAIAIPGFNKPNPQRHHREPPNQVSHLESGTGGRKL